MKYVMVTHFNGHWDKCKDGKTSYLISMLRDKMKSALLKENTSTVFIKIHPESKKIERAWIGSVSEIKKDDSAGKIWFNVHIKSTITCPEKYTTLTQGWHLDADDALITDAEKTHEPPFFSKMDFNTWEEFEDNTFHLLRLIGIHNIHRYSRKNQKGLPDGFFKFGRMAVIYDCTIDPNFESKKSTQIDNFCSQLEKNKIKTEAHEFDIKDCDKYVWVITRNSNPRTIKSTDAAVVKEVPVQTLMEIYYKRLQEPDLNEKRLEKQLQDV